MVDRTSALSETSRTEFSAILWQKVRPKFGRTFRKFYADSVEFKIISVRQPSQKLHLILFYQSKWKFFAFTYIIWVGSVIYQSTTTCLFIYFNQYYLFSIYKSWDHIIMGYKYLDFLIDNKIWIGKCLHF